MTELSLPDQRFLEVIQAARAEHLDPVDALSDYLTEKDSHLGRVQVVRMVERLLSLVEVKP